jgi:hypothetical protein
VPQILALRFASDEEFLSLMDAPKIRTMSGLEIKEQITQWLPDTMRI